MTEHLSAGWLEAAATRFAEVRLNPPADGPGLVVDVRVHDDADQDAIVAHFALDVHGDRIRLQVDPTTDEGRPSVRLRTTRAVARRIADGSLSAQRAFMAGSLRLGGDVTELLAHREVLASVGDVLVDLRPAD